MWLNPDPTNLIIFLSSYMKHILFFLSADECGILECYTFSKWSFKT